jgi:hypothetical protein
MVHLFIHLLLNANHEVGNWRGVEVKRGQILTGLNSLNKKTGISIRTLRTCLDRLEKTKEIDRKTTNRYSIITICNYESYQCSIIESDKQPDKQLTGKRQANDKQVTTNNNNKNDNNEKKEKKYSNIPPTFEEIKIRMEERQIVSFTPELFFSKYEANGWMVGKNKMKNWDSALTYWTKNNFNKNENNSSDNRRSVKRINSEWDN